MELDEDLFRHEAGRMIATLTRVFGPHNLTLAQDVVQDAFCRAVEVWRMRGIPENPSAWLMMAAKNRALDVLRRERTARTFAPELGRMLSSEWTIAPIVEDLFAEDAIKDDLLRMMFSCCHPHLAAEGKVALILHILCGFSVDEIAAAFVSSHAAIEKRITRAKKVLATSNTLFDLAAPADFADRLPAVHRALYLLFNEGYHGASPASAVRAELCHEAMRLSGVLLTHPLGAVPVTFALSALMCFNAARLPARLDSAGNMISLFDQDRALWDKPLVTEGLKLLELSAAGPVLSTYHIEAAIASAHATALRAEETDWSAIISLYDKLIAIDPSPVVALNRVIAIAQRDGPERALAEIVKTAERDRLSAYPFYYAAIGELELSRGRTEAARDHFEASLALARNPEERRHLERRISVCATADLR
jgi:RNA polymerase sigma factor (sigma-70 family)